MEVSLGYADVPPIIADTSDRGLAAARNRLTDVQLQLCAPKVWGYSMRTKVWRMLLSSTTTIVAAC